MSDPSRTYLGRRPRSGRANGYVEYDGKSGRDRKPFDDIGSSAARRFYVQQSMAGRNPRLVRADAPADQQEQTREQD